MSRFAVFTLILCALVGEAFAGGPRFVAGVTGFDEGLSGQPIVWRNGQISYYTDQGGLSPILDHASADALVADAFSHWTTVSTAAVNANQGGTLDEDVSRVNVWQSSFGLFLPDDLQAYSPKSLAIVYDFDGSVIDALYGEGAGDESVCSTNAVLENVDRFSSDGFIAHALVFINGTCIKQSADIAILKYKLVRALGRVLGLDWSQLNDNVVSGNPPPKADDYAGYPLMHPMGALCGIGYGCMANADQLRPDDRAALSHLYPVVAENLGNFTGKTITASMTGRIHGSVRFPIYNGLSQGMQGVTS